MTATVRADVDIVSSATYFGDPQAPIFGVVSRPADDLVRGGIVVCGSLGKEHAQTPRGMKYLAEHLAARGFLVLRFDYANTGESAGPQQDPHAVDRWMASIRTAVDTVREFGVPDVGVIGLRAGALLITQDAELVADLDTLVLWDPVAKGRQFVRAQKALYTVISSADADASVADVAEDPDRDLVNLAGQTLHAEAAAQLSAMRLRTEPVTARPAGTTVAFLRETDRTGAVATALTDAGTPVESCGDPTYFLEPMNPSYVSIPEELDQIVEWFDQRYADAAPRAVTVDTQPQAIVAHTVDGRPIETRVYTAPSGAVVWDTAIAGHHDAADKVVISHSIGHDSRIGPARLWAELSLDVASRGGRMLRFDRVGVGESGRARKEDVYIDLYTDGYVARGVQIMESLRLPAGAQVVHTGICVGSWMSAHAALHTREVLGQNVSPTAVLVNPLMWRLRPGITYSPRALEFNTFGSRARRRLIQLVGEYATPTIRRLTPRRWHDTIGRAPILQMPEALCASLWAHGAQLALVLGPEDYAYFDSLGGPRALATGRAQVRITRSSEGDHSAYNARLRAAAKQACLDALDLTS
ncbi:hypothetical protein [Gordonia sp. N1V]|uniref:hypothetical protein n=1 Tax=Gordonia sp. N1V TaxID=3034163 RepID=UPI0023E09D03|nr:hypothetical protein [Gordonia sp. N1V]MDF3284079.1 hypothetical protein [Gordonia sp. N1V]